MNNEGIFGGTGLLGSEAAKQLIERGHEVTSIALPPLPAGAVLPPEMKIEYDNCLEMTDDEVRAYMKGCEGFIFAAGVDERRHRRRRAPADPVGHVARLPAELNGQPCVGCAQPPGL